MGIDKNRYEREVEEFTRKCGGTELLKEKGPKTKKEIAEELGVHKGTITNIVVKLKKEKKITISGKKGNAPIYTIMEPETQSEEVEEN